MTFLLTLVLTILATMTLVQAQQEIDSKAPLILTIEDDTGNLTYAQKAAHAAKLIPVVQDSLDVELSGPECGFTFYRDRSFTSIPDVTPYDADGNPIPLERSGDDPHPDSSPKALIVALNHRSLVKRE